jgi:hypothetical protein
LSGKGSNAITRPPPPTSRAQDHAVESQVGADVVDGHSGPREQLEKARTVIVAAVHGGKGIYDLFRLLAGDGCGPLAELSRLGRNQIVEKVY